MARAPAGRKKRWAGAVRSFVPDGTRSILALKPSDESLGYFRASLRDVEPRRANRLRGPGLQNHRVGRVPSRGVTGNQSGNSGSIPTITRLFPSRPTNCESGEWQTVIRSSGNSW